jgi:hypothetical protein
LAFGVAKSNERMHVVGHDHVPIDKMTLAFQVVKPVVHDVIPIGDLKQL